MEQTKLEIRIVLALVVATGLLLALAPDRGPEWCRPGSAGQAALEAEVRSAVAGVHHDGRPSVSESAIREKLMGWCG